LQQIVRLSYALAFWMGIAAGHTIPSASAQRSRGSSNLAGAPVDSATAAGMKKEVLAATDMIWAWKTPMRDGIRLNGTVFKPSGQKDPLPVIFTLTPYIADSYQEPRSTCPSRRIKRRTISLVGYSDR
jgi:predicted acyl esterase